MSELLGDGSEPSRHPRCRCDGLHIRHRFDLGGVATTKIARATHAAGQQNKTCAVKRNDFGAGNTQNHRGQRIDVVPRTSNHRDRMISVIENSDSPND